MDYNYHTHTYRCRHASGTEEEYIARAIENGIKRLGFSDHMPLRFADGTESGYRVPVCEAAEYCETIKALGEKYRGQVEIKAGFEAEYYTEYFDEMLQNVIDYGAEYLILGQHFLGPENLQNRHSFAETDRVEDLKVYTDLVIEGMRRGVFSYVAHPDVLHFVGDDAVYRREVERLCSASRELGIPLEINFLGIRDGRYYPNEVFWQIAGREGAPVTFGFDAHDAMSAFDGESLPKAERLVEKYRLNYIGEPRLIELRPFARK